MDLSTIKGKVLKQMIESSVKEKSDFIKTGDEIMSFSHKADADTVYQNLGLEASLWFKTTVGMTAQAIDEMCPYLYPANPYRCGTVRKRQFLNPALKQIEEARNTLMVEYLNYTPEEMDLYGESIRAINQTQAYGAGVLWTGFNQRKGLVGSRYGDIKELQIDPDATILDEAKWTARSYKERRWELADQFPQAAQLIAGLKADKRSKTNEDGKVGDLIEYYRVWMRVGLHRYIDGGLPEVDDMGQPIQYTDEPMLYVVSAEGKLISEGPWETPVHLDNMWPFEMNSYIEDQDSIWPISPMRSALPFQKALNWLYIFYMTKIRFCSRSLFGVMDYGQDSLGTDNEKLLEMMNDLPFLKVRCQNENVKISDLFQQLNLDPGLENFERAHAIIKREFQEHSGHYDIFHTGESETQDRSATTTNFKDKTSKTRLNYRLDRVKKWQAKVARKEAMIARLIHTPEQIDTILGQGSGQIWGQVMPVQDGMQNPYFVNYEQWAKETDYSIESDSMRRNDIETKRDALKEAMNTVVPVQLASIDLTEKAAAYMTIADYYETIGCPDKVVQEQLDLAAYFKEQAMLQAQMAQQMQAQAPIPGPGSQQPAAPAPAAGGY